MTNAPSDDMGEVGLSVRGLTTEIRIGGKWLQAVRDVSFDVREKETVALVGESGCGKSLTALSIMKLLPRAVGRMTADHVRIGSDDIAAATDATMEGIRGDRIGMIFQEPMTSLNPVLPIGFQIAEPLIYHKGLSRAAARDRVVELLELVRIPAAAERLDQYPHQFSGGMRQRVMIAVALACAPKVLIADEPTTALDVTIQAQVLALLAQLQKSAGLAVLLITHNLGVVASVADRVLVMYGGDVVESAQVRDFFARPTHPYSAALLAAMPRADRSADALMPIPGQVPTLAEMPSGCRFQSRCTLRESRCSERPPLAPINTDETHAVRCWVRGRS
jgi:peptide/nickel transport system ATP-binding protein